MPRCVLLAFLLPTASFGACEDDGACPVKNAALVQRTVTHHITKITDSASEAEGTPADALDVLPIDYMFCLAKGPMRKRSVGTPPNNVSWDERVDDGDCEKMCKSKANLAENACEEGGSMGAVCGCIDYTEVAKTSCAGKAPGDECSFKSGIFNKTTENDSTQIEFKTMCQDYEGTLSCLPLRGLGCGNQLSGWARVGSRCINGLGSDIVRSTGEFKGGTFHAQRKILSYCVYKNETEVGQPKAEMTCLSHYNPKVPTLSQQE